MENKIFLTAAEAGELLGVSKWTINHLMYKREIPFYKVGKCNRFKRADLERFIEQKRIESVY